MQNFIPSFKKRFTTYGVLIALTIGFAGGNLFQSLHWKPIYSGTNMNAGFSGLSSSNSGNGGTATICTLAQMPANDERRGIIVGLTEYNDARNAYHIAHPDAPAGSVTWGATIGKEYLIAVINSLPAAENNVQYSFASEANGKVSVYFKGGTINPVTGQTGTTTVVAKTGTNADAYCPSHCD